MEPAPRIPTILFAAGLLATAVLAAWLAGPRVLGLLAASASVAAPATLLAAGVGAPLALCIAKTDAHGRRFALVALAGLVILPLHAVAAGWLAAVGFRGWVTALAAPTGTATALLDGWRGAVAVHAVAAMPLVTLLSVVALRAVDHRREEQAALEAPAGRVLWSVSFRDAAPALIAAVIGAAAPAVTEIAITDLFRVRTFAEEVYTQAAVGSADASPTGGAVGLLAGATLIAVTLAVVIGVFASRLVAAAETARTAWRVRLGRSRAGATVALIAVVAVLTAAPIGSLAYKAGETIVRDGDAWRRDWSAAKCVGAVLEAPWRHRREIAVSASLGVAVATASVAIAGAVVWGLRASALGRRVVVLAVAIGLAVPGPVVGLATIRCLNQPFDSAFGWVGMLYGTWFAPWLAQVVRLTPIAALLLTPVAASVPTALLDAARSDGAGPLARLGRVAIPMRWPAIAATWVALFALSVGEVSATALVVPPGTPPLSVRLLSLLHYGVEDRVASLCLGLFAAYAGAAWLGLRWYGAGLRARGRVS